MRTKGTLHAYSAQLLHSVLKRSNVVTRASDDARVASSSLRQLRGHEVQVVLPAAALAA